MGNLKFITENLEILYRLNKIGIKNINVALDYYSIYQKFLTYQHLSKMEQVEMTAIDCKVSTNSVRRAVELLTK